ncbi:50S ribosomal protein L19 [Candidatus Peregrinibacteria bacterium]|jgi:large subunit ribosomal protein L19|nr:50S ribosomal protein L19 [Candidatus Peregrinibacteria bacterium]MBT5516973.1 50S ribosomal protein L19 [Candidatus Peregrinibacteria bacterium]MBT5823654.1 50S ribosomal protein L19 [Candidatus Peregrinibacteria bacterium]
MSQAILDHVASSSIQRQVPVLKPGYTVRVHQRITEGAKERTQIFEGLLIKLSSGTGVNRTFTVRRIVDGIGVEKTFPLFAPSLEKIEVVKAGKVRRSKLYFMRERTGKSARLRDVPVGEIKMMGSLPTPEVTEEPAAAEAEVVETPTEPETPEVTEAPAEPAAPEATSEEAPEAKEETKEEAPAEEPKEEEKAE